MPALLMLCVLVLMSGFVWTKVFDSLEDIETATSCNPPSPPTGPAQASGQEPVKLGTMLPRTGLDHASPAPPQDIPVRVLNGNGESNQASLISEQMTTLGFAEGGKPADDPVYTNYDLNCHGQIRFGDAGEGAARTASLIAPCAQLVRDGRPDAGVDFVLGAEFDDIKTTPEAKRILQELKNWAPQQDGSSPQDVAPPRFSGELLTNARDVHC